MLELEIDSSSGRRPAIRYQYNGDYVQVFCLYARTEGNISFLSYQVCNLLGDGLKERIVDVSDITYESYEAVIREVLPRYPQIKLISVGVQGGVNQGIIGECGIKVLEGMAIEARLKEKYELDIIA